MIIFGIIEIILSQIPNFHELSWLSAVAAVMSFGYSTIGLGLSIAKAVGGNQARTSLTGTTVGVDVTSWQKTWNCFEAIGDIAFAFAFSTVLVEIQASPPGFNGTLFLSNKRKDFHSCNWHGIGKRKDFDSCNWHGIAGYTETKSTRK